MIARPRLVDMPPGSLQGPQRVCLSAIVREDDPKIMRRCLESVRPFVGAFAIVLDTRSTEAVRDTICEVLAALPGELIEREWPGRFDVARNLALDSARASGCEYSLFVDSDDWIVPLRFNLERGVASLRPLPRITCPIARWATHNGRVIVYRETFARLSPALRWEGHVHEHLVPAPLSARMPEDYCVMYGTDGISWRDEPAKHALYDSLMRQRLESDPNDGHAWYSHGVVCALRGDLAIARACLARATSLGAPTGNLEEILAALPPRAQAPAPGASAA